MLFAFSEYFAPHAGDMADEILIRRIDPTAKAQHHLTHNFAFVNYGVGGQAHKWTATVYNSETHEMTTPLITSPAVGSAEIVFTALAISTSVIPTRLAAAR